MLAVEGQSSKVTQASPIKTPEVINQSDPRSFQRSHFCILEAIAIESKMALSFFRLELTVHKVCRVKNVFVAKTAFY